MATIETEEKSDYDQAVKNMQCPYCKSTHFIEIRFEGLYCAGCNTRAEIRAPGGDRGGIIRFDPSTMWKGTLGEVAPLHIIEQKWLYGSDEPYWTTERDKVPA